MDSSRPALPVPKNGARYRVAIYERVSRPTSITGSHTFETQMPRILEMLDRRLGAGRYKVVCFGEDGQSGGLGPAPSGTQRRVRPDLVRLQKALETHAFDHLAFYSSDRFMRNARWFLQFVEDVLFPTNTSALSATEEMDLVSANGYFSSAMLALVNDFYRRSSSARLIDASATRRAAGFWVGPPPYGWRRQARDPNPSDRPGIEPHPDTAPVVQRIRARYLEGANIVTIARELNEDSVPSAEGGLWNGEIVWSVLCHPAHAGLMWSQPRQQGDLVPASISTRASTNARTTTPFGDAACAAPWPGAPTARAPTRPICSTDWPAAAVAGTASPWVSARAMPPAGFTRIAITVAPTA